MSLDLSADKIAQAMEHLSSKIGDIATVAKNLENDIRRPLNAIAIAAVALDNFIIELRNEIDRIKSERG